MGIKHKSKPVNEELIKFLQANFEQLVAYRQQFISKFKEIEDETIKMREAQVKLEVQITTIGKWIEELGGLPKDSKGEK